MPNIPTKRLRLIECTPPLFELLFQDLPALSLRLNIAIPEHWTHFGLAPFKYAYDKIIAQPADAGWWSYLIVHQRDQGLIGTCGYKGPPNGEGEVEIGYEIIQTYQNRGLATETAEALIAEAFNRSAVKKVKAHTLAEENASVQVLKKCGLHFVHTLFDPDDGDIWLWEIQKEEWLKGRSSGK